MIKIKFIIKRIFGILPVLKDNQIKVCSTIGRIVTQFFNRFILFLHLGLPIERILKLPKKGRCYTGYLFKLV
jgi:hypothetical protein